MKRLLVESHEEDALKDALDNLSRLSAAKRAHLIENEEEVDYLFSITDQDELANSLYILTHFLARLRIAPEDRGGSTLGVSPTSRADDSDSAAPIPIFRCNPDESAGHSVKA